MRVECKNIDLKKTLLSGQCFRVKEESDSSFTLILDDRVVNIKQISEHLEVLSNKKQNLKNKITNYLDLGRDYEKINNYLISRDSKMRDIIDYCKGYKILKQPKVETIISYIISQNNTVKNISKCIEKLSQMCGEKVVFKEREYYLFPTLNDLNKLTVEDFKKCSVGFRSEYIMNMLERFNKDKEYIESLDKMSTSEALAKLKEIKGIGTKVASCIVMFAFGRMDAFPIDTWVKKYFNLKKETDIQTKVYETFGEYSGLMIQYVFHYSRNKGSL